MTSSNQSRLPGALFNIQRQSLGRAVAIGLVYFLVVRFSLLFPDSENVMAAVWPPSGIALGALLLTRKRDWFLVLTAIGVANFVGNISFGKSIPVSLGYVVSNLAEAMLAAWFIARWSGQEVVRFARVGEVLALIGAAVITNGCTTLLGAATASLGAGAAFWPSYANWWVADGMGMLIVTPLIITWATGGSEMLRTLSPQRLAELAAFLFAWCVAVWLVFGPDGQNQIIPLRPYMILPLLGWAALRFRPCIAVTASVVLVIISVSYGDTSQSARILGGDDPANRLVMIQIYIALLAIPAFLLSVSMFERASVEQRLRESEARFRQMFEQHGSVMLLIEPDSGDIVDANAAATSFYGRSVESMRAMRIQDINALSPAEVTAERNRATQGERSYFVFPHRVAGGEIRTVEVRSSPVKVSGRALLFSIVTDITERQRLEQEQDRYLRFFQLSTDPMCIADPFGCFKQVNPAFTKLTGYSDSELVAKPFIDFVFPEDKQRTVEEMKLQVALRPSLRFENRYVCKDGSVILLSWTAYFDKKDGFTYATARDITALRQAEERLEQFFALVPDLMCIATVGGKFLKINPAWMAMLGYTEQELLSTPFIEFVHPEDRETTNDAVRRQLAGEPILNFINRYRCKDGSYRWLEWRTTPALDQTLIFATARDITDRNLAEARHARLEAQLRESQKMEALGTMAGGVAHDFNNALAMIIGNTELARQDVAPDHPAMVSLDEIAKASRRAKDLVQQILAFGRRQNLERKATSLALVVVETARLVRATLPAMVSLNVNCEPDAPAVLADATQVKQILLNLCGNAIQAIQSQGSFGKVEINLRAHVQSEAVASSNLKQGRYACLTVRDTGPGMDEATRSHIFEPFFTTKPVGKGTGLGLSVVHGIVQAHDATIEVESAPGKGSVFRIYFPAIDAQVEQATQPEGGSVQVDGAGKRVLYVDDEEAIIFLMQRLLERQGFRVSGFTDPREAVAAVRANPGEFDLAVTDFNMPGMSGLEVASALREIRPDLPVVLASGYITEDLRQKAPAAGVRELIYKPNTVDDLCEAVARYANAQIKLAS